jgi:threonine/homoserine/homoserine lactone efflux protein
MHIDHFLAFAFTAFLLNLTPGNDMLFVLARSISQGTKAGIISSFGIMAGCTFHMIAAVAGLSVIISKSAIAFEIIKYIGACYLIFLGIQSILAKREKLGAADGFLKSSYRKIFLQGLLTNVLNPKVALFFLAFLPQFINLHAGNVTLQILFLGIWFTMGGTMVNIIVSVLIGKFGSWLASSPAFIQWQKRITGCILITLGIKMAAGTRK